MSVASSYCAACDTTGPLGCECVAHEGLTFDMSGRQKAQPFGCPLDGGVSPQTDEEHKTLPLHFERPLVRWHSSFDGQTCTDRNQQAMLPDFPPCTHRAAHPRTRAMFSRCFDS